ncbi:hypothetical protein [Cryobacterium zhongshanensis]|uniref:Uncharacterized protein n=1 Tax=Cryobacterium zhongshanensis TaxID=2928153 RepID=A0AA41QYU1_9MICO|nr:hypothetical protein [Cryobacterium zhongshanensis]MCI4659639.1 hypothetical protein [Cryobacterium zhongshanensis]
MSKEPSADADPRIAIPLRVALFASKEMVAVVGLLGITTVIFFAMFVYAASFLPQASSQTPHRLVLAIALFTAVCSLATGATIAQYAIRKNIATYCRDHPLPV